MNEIDQMLSEWQDAPPSLLRVFRSVLEDRERLREELTIQCGLLEAYKEASGIVHQIEYVDSINRQLHKEAKEVVALRERVKVLEDALRPFAEKYLSFGKVTSDNYWTAIRLLEIK